MQVQQGRQHRLGWRAGVVIEVMAVVDDYLASPPPGRCHLLAAIAAEPAAQAMFDLLTKTNRFALICRLNAVKRPQTRDRKIREFVAMLGPP